MSDDRIDLSALHDDSSDAVLEGAQDRVIANVMRGVRGNETMRRPTSHTLELVVGWARPALAAAAILAIAASLSLRLESRGPVQRVSSQTGAQTVPSAAAALGVDPAIMRWTGASGTPSAADLIATLQGYTQ